MTLYGSATDGLIQHFGLVSVVATLVPKSYSEFSLATAFQAKSNPAYDLKDNMAGLLQWPKMLQSLFRLTISESI